MNELTRFVTGNGVYTDDINRDNQHYMVVVRSTKAHADFEIRNINALKKHKDVACIVDHKMMIDSDFKPFITASKRSSRPWGNALLPRLMNAFADVCHWLHKEHFLNLIRFFSYKGNMPHMDILPAKTVHYVGQPLCAIVAHSLDCALKVAAMVDVVYQEHPAVTNLHAAKTNKKRVHSQFEDNVIFDISTLHKEQVEQALDCSDHVFHLEIENQRLSPNTLEPRCCHAWYDAEKNEYIIEIATQGVNSTKVDIAAMFKKKKNKPTLHVITKDVGGGFGLKGSPRFPEYFMAMVASKLISAPVKWNNTRKESFLSDYHGRGVDSQVTLGMNKDCVFTGMKIHNDINIGAFVMSALPIMSIAASNFVAGGIYDYPYAYSKNTMYYTNQVPVGAYRGAWRPEAIYAIERTIDYAARKLKICPIQLRLKNVIKPEQLPYETYFISEYDSGDFPGIIKEAEAKSDWHGFESRKKASAGNGLLRGRGFATYVEIMPSAFMGKRDVTLTLTKEAKVLLHIGSGSSGTHITSNLAKYLAKELVCDPAAIDVDISSSKLVKSGSAAGGSTTTATSFQAVSEALQRLVHKASQRWAKSMGVDKNQVTYKEGYLIFEKNKVKLLDFVKDFSEQDALTVSCSVSGKNSFSNGAYACEVEVNPNTGRVTLVKMTCVDDIGTVLNEQHVEGQIQGGFAQALGQVLMEHVQYDDQGQLQTDSFWEYAMPKAEHMVNIDNSYRPTGTKANQFGIKGVGESATTGGCAAVVNAVMDALSAYEIDNIQMPLTPEKVWRAMQTGKKTNSESTTGE